MHPQPLCALPPSLPRASQLAARALDGQVELVVRAVGAVRVGVPPPRSPPPALPAFFSFSVSSSARNACSSDVVQVHLLRMCSTMRVLPPQKGWPQSLHTRLGVVVSSLPTTVTVFQILPVRNQWHHHWRCALLGRATNRLERRVETSGASSSCCWRGVGIGRRGLHRGA